MCFFGRLNIISRLLLFRTGYNWQHCPGTGEHGIWTSGQRFNHTANSRFVWKDKWWTGETVATHELSYTNWKQGEPSNSGNNESCIQIMTDRPQYTLSWNDVNCHLPLCFICDTKRPPTPQTGKGVRFKIE